MQDALLHVSKWLGFFRLSRHLTRRTLRILCYHGFAAGDEVAFRPGLFITMPTFEKRLQTLRRGGYTVVTLQKGLEALDKDTIDHQTVVITVDDVFHNVAALAVPKLKQFGMTATMYVTTYYCVKQTPVFRLVVRYMFWKTTRVNLVLSEIDPGLSGTVNLENLREREEAENKVVQFGEALQDDADRGALGRRLGVRLGIDYEQIAAARTFNVVSPAQVRELAEAGIDIQLHTHRHRLPKIASETVREIRDNRTILEPLVGGELQHLCYPSGLWSRILWPWLTEAGVVSATTCDAGLNYQDTPRLALKRILDGEDLSHIRFEAELTGFKPLLRQFRERIRSVFGRGAEDVPPLASQM